MYKNIFDVHEIVTNYDKRGLVRDYDGCRVKIGFREF